MKKTFIIIIVMVCVTLQIFFWPKNNPIDSRLTYSGKEEEKIFRKACYDCHSDETRWPWYSYVFPISVFTVHHVREGREELNFSQWKNLPPNKQSAKSTTILEEIEKREMPLGSYLILHKEANINSEDLEVIKKWAEGFDAGEN
jgi:uncharacterized protein YxeA